MSDKILQLFDRPVDRRIEEVVKVDQTNVDVVREEIAEYVATPTLRRSFCRILEQFRETPNKPHEGIGIWISGFFGAGKSLFAKILGYILENRQLDETSAAELFGRQTADPEVQALLNAIVEQIPAKAVIFDVSTDQTVTDAAEKLTDVLYRVMLREFGYATDLHIAELEIELEGKGKLKDFEAVVQRVSGTDWSWTWDPGSHRTWRDSSTATSTAWARPDCRMPSSPLCKRSFPVRSRCTWCVAATSHWPP